MSSLYEVLNEFINRAVKTLVYAMLMLFLVNFIGLLGSISIYVIRQMPQPTVYGARPVSEVKQIYVVPTPTVVEEYVAEPSFANLSSINSISVIAEAIASIIETSLANQSSVNSPSLANISSTNSISNVNLSSINSISSANLSSIETVSTANESSTNSVSIVSLA